MGDGKDRIKKEWGLSSGENNKKEKQKSKRERPYYKKRPLRSVTRY